VSIDTEIAYDKIQHPFMMKIFRKPEIEENFLKKYCLKKNTTS